MRKLCFLGSSCIYPKLAPQPMREDALLTGPLEPTNEWYAIAKIAGIKLCQAYRRQYGFNAISVMPTNLYGPGDNFDLQNSHVLPALMRRFHEAKVTRRSRGGRLGHGHAAPRVPARGRPGRAPSCTSCAGTTARSSSTSAAAGRDDRRTRRHGRRAVGYRGRIGFDATKPDGTPRKLLDVSRLTALGWRPRIGLEDGIRSTYRWFLANEAALRGVAH